MEKISTKESSSNSFHDDLTIVYTLIGEYRDKVNSADHESDKNKKRDLIFKINLIALVIVVSLYSALSFLPESMWGSGFNTIRLILQFMVLLIYILCAISVSLQYLSVRDVFKDFTGQIIGVASDSAKDEADLLKGLDNVSKESIEYAAYRIENSSIQLTQLRSFLIGAIEKIGIIPGLLATVIAINKVANTTGGSWIELLSIIMVAVYFSMFPITEAIIKTKRISVLLNQYLILFRRDKRLSS